MKSNITLLLILIFSGFGCRQRESKNIVKIPSFDFNEVTDFYTPVESYELFSTSVADTFKILKSLPDNYDGDTTLRYPLILLLDANAYMAPLVQELALAQLTQGLPKCVIIGVGYKNFWMMDSLRSRDYTPVESNQTGFGGGDKFEKFLNSELIPSLKKNYRIEENQIVLMGHSLGGVFTLHYLINSIQRSTTVVSNFISASPPVHDDNFLLFKKEANLSDVQRKLPFRLYSSRGTLELDSPVSKNFFLDFQRQISSHYYPNSKIKFVEYGNFEHMDAAMPGFIKGLIFIFKEY